LNFNLTKESTWVLSHIMVFKPSLILNEKN